MLQENIDFSKDVSKLVVDKNSRNAMIVVHRPKYKDDLFWV